MHFFIQNLRQKYIPVRIDITPLAGYNEFTVYRKGDARYAETERFQEQETHYRRKY